MVWVDQIDATTAPVFRGAMTDLDPKVQFVVIDMTQVRFVDSAGLSSLLALQRRLYARDVRLCVCGLTRTVQALFELMQVQRLIDVFASREAALAHYGVSGAE